MTLEMLRFIICALMLDVSLTESLDDNPCHEEQAKSVIHLPEIDLQSESALSQMFFIESSGRNHLLTRQLCAIESAIKNAQVEQIVIVMTSQQLDLTANNGTLQLFNAYPDLKWTHVNLEKLFEGTKIYDIWKSGKLAMKDKNLEKLKDGRIAGYDETKVPAVNLCDAIRLVLLDKVGGWYSDLDMVFLKSVKHLKNVVASDNFDTRRRFEEGYLGDGYLSNAIFQFEKGHQFLNVSIQLFPKLFNGKWGSGGPSVLRRAYKLICPKHPDICQSINVLPPWSFYPEPWNRAANFVTQEKPDFWNEVFKESYAVHFYASSAPNKRLLRPNYYGKEVPAYVYLGPKHCPLSFFSERMF